MIAEYPMCPYCGRPVWENQPQYRGWHLWCDEQTAPPDHYADWLWYSDPNSRKIRTHQKTNVE